MPGKRICRVKLQMVDALSGAAVHRCSGEVGGVRSKGNEEWSGNGSLERCNSRARDAYLSDSAATLRLATFGMTAGP